MGVQVRLVVYAPDQATAARACIAAYKRIAQLEQITSDYRPDSELMQLCARSGAVNAHEWVRVSPELFFVLQRSQELSRRSGGAFDITVGPYVALWRRARKTGVFPSPQELQPLRRVTGWRKIHLDPKTQRVRLQESGMKLDLGGIAKGYAGDEALRVLKAHGVTSALFQAGGDIVVSDAPPGKKGWSIAVPGANGKNRTLLPANAAVSTSGDLYQSVMFNGRRYSHVVDPRTGLGLTQRFEATVVARDGITSDSVSTAACVLGPQQGRKLIKCYNGAWGIIQHAADSNSNNDLTSTQPRGETP
ncbi:MAG TPA: FAD:protein FMN transferase [Abditibacteriaceae bacterium]